MKIQTNVKTNEDTNEDTNKGNWGGIVISPNPKKTSVFLKMDAQGNIIEEVETVSGDRMAEIAKRRAEKLGLK